MDLLTIKDLRVQFSTYGGAVEAVQGVDLSVKKGKTLAVVGESGSGKSVTFQSILGLIPQPPGKILTGEALFQGTDLFQLQEKELVRYRGRKIAMIFQDPMSSLNPTMTVFRQIAEVLPDKSRQTDKERVVELLKKVQIPEPEKRMWQYPFQFSGGMRQRVMIAIALASNPELLIADEPTTALDVSIQAQILDLLKSLQTEHGMGLVLITHDLGVVAKMADEVAIMYAGRVVEKGSVDDIFYRPYHPYNVGLKNSMPDRARGTGKLEIIEGSPPDLFAPPSGCAFHPRCTYATIQCAKEVPSWKEDQHKHGTSCWLHDPEAVRPESLAEIKQ